MQVQIALRRRLVRLASPPSTTTAFAVAVPSSHHSSPSSNGGGYRRSTDLAVDDLLGPFARTHGRLPGEFGVASVLPSPFTSGLGFVPPSFCDSTEFGVPPPHFDPTPPIWAFLLLPPTATPTSATASGGEERTRRGDEARMESPSHLAVSEFNFNDVTSLLC
ncbi:hypothetical protein MSAN_02376000 [Mycena sanguinolenta]|uniref:Uncharacterized protein n=1 Tax=Mycena sanguinolenta TaxID=230812 RepID=A0A8H6X4K0_9AGAR|nr:hypothetical protein MSAN_02376000 [Mycena sanguinolenta]